MDQALVMASAPATVTAMATDMATAATQDTDMAQATATAQAMAMPPSAQQLEGAEGAIIYWSKRGLKWKSTRTTTTKNATKA